MTNKKDITYDEFVNKFKPKLTTDDCETPDEIYDIIKRYAVRHYHYENRRIIRPFWNNGIDYKDYDYSGDCVVIDNPPFSIISKIVRWYEENHIDYFLFAPGLTNLSIRVATSHVCAFADIRYKNGALVRTSFVSSRGHTIESCPELYTLITDYYKSKRKPKPKIVFSDNVVTSSKIGMFSKYGIDYVEDSNLFISKAKIGDSERRIFGGAYIVEQNNIKNKLTELENKRADKIFMEKICGYSK